MTTPTCPASGSESADPDSPADDTGRDPDPDTDPDTDLGPERDLGPEHDPGPGPERDETIPPSLPRKEGYQPL